MRKAFMLSVAVAFCSPGIAVSQTVVNSFEDLRPLLKAERRITIIDEAGTEIRGRVVEVAPNSFVVASDSATAGQERRSFGARPLRAAVAKPDGLGNGIVLGLLAGLAAAPAVCNGLWGGCDQLTGLAAMAVTVPSGIGVGILIDFFRRDQEIRVEYLRNSPVAVGAKPLIGSGRRGLALAFQW